MKSPARSKRTGAATLRRALLRWYDTNRRDLPWRRSRDPYAIWISETMLQQTRVETVIPYYERFLERFPDVETLASADCEDVYQRWAGLGYYSRARNLHAAAQKVVDEFGGSLPSDSSALRSLPGIGRYTAGALASIAFDRPEPVVDGNVARVLTRVFGIREDIGSKRVLDRLWQEAGALARGRRPGDLNQALMELGATICLARAPRCLACPLVRHCNAYRAGDAEALPVKTAKAVPRRVQATAAWLERRGQVLVVRRPEGVLLGGLWELPGGPLAASEPPAAGLRRALRERIGLRVARARRVGDIEHGFTHRLLRLHVFRCEPPAGRIRLAEYDRHKWVTVDTLATLPRATLTNKALALLEIRPNLA